MTVKRPEFHATKHGYDMREVDMCIETLRTENETLTRVNNELYLLWINEFSNKGDYMQEWAKSDGNEDKLYNLFAAAQKHSPPQQEAPMEEEISLDEGKKRPRAWTFLKGFLFYATLAAIVFSAFLFSGDPTGPPQDIAGFSAMTVLTRSMQSVLPQHALIVTRKADPQTIQVGDDITFLTPNNATVTHRVIEVLENHQNSGMRGFRTQGVENENPDAEVVLAQNVIGRVIFHNLTIGRTVHLVRNNILLAGIGLALLILVAVLTKLLRTVFTQKNTVPTDRILNKSKKIKKRKQVSL